MSTSWNSGQPLKFECCTACEKASVLLHKEGKSIKTKQLQDFDYMSKTANFLIVSRWGDLGRLLHSSDFFVLMKVKVKKGSPRILEWVAYPFSSGSSWPRNRTRVSCIAGGFFTNWAIQFSSVQFSRSVVSDSLRSCEWQHARLPCPSPTPGVHSDSRPSSQWCHPAISSSVIPFSSCP